ncbi:MAG: hypothetical protein IJ593_12620 [Lachnospiraceae bacterium]|nr:hypothetical protein [Lachnospiraceae bacterium]MBR1455466.1 hypothetical protein [Lachnospiraceae bacterium]
MINKNIFTELEKVLKSKGCEVLNNERSKEYFQFIYDDSTFEIEKNSGLISPDVPNLIDDDLVHISDSMINKWNEIIEIISKVLKKLNIDSGYPYNLGLYQEYCINKKIYRLIMKYDNVCLFYRDHGFFGISYHILYESITKEDEEVFDLFIPYEDENIVYNLKDAISIFSKRSGLYEVKELQNSSSFTLSELNTVLYILSNEHNVTSNQKELISSFSKKALKLIKMKGNDKL